MNQNYFRNLCLVLTGLGASAPLAMGIDINSCPSVISAPGNYTLVTDLTCSTDGHAITIKASNVSLNLNGHIIRSSNGSTAGITVAGSGRLDHVAVAGPGLITGFVQGVIFAQTDYSQLSQVTVANSGFNGVRVVSSTFATIASNVLVANKGAGVTLLGTTSSTIQGNNASGNGSSDQPLAGIAIDSGSSGNTINNNIADANIDSGIRVFSGTSASRIFSNTTNGNTNAGITIDSGSTGNQVFNNSSSVGNTNFDLVDNNSGCTGDAWSSNVFFTRSPASCVR